MKKYLLLLLFPATLLAQDYITIDNFNDLQQFVLSNANSDGCVIFDIDGVLITPEKEFNFKHPIRKSLLSKLAQKSSEEELTAYKAAIFKKRRTIPLNPRIPLLVSTLQTRGIPTFALTSWWTGPMGEIEQMEELRFEGLESAKIDFSRSSPLGPDQDFKQLATKRGTPMLRSGVLITGTQAKGPTLEAALENSEWKPQSVLLIDDMPTNLQSVERVCKRLNIPFTGVLYSEENHLPQPELDEDFETLRFQLLERDGEWLRDEELVKWLRLEQEAEAADR